MSPFKFDDFNERRDAAAKAKQAMLEKFRAKQRPTTSAEAPAADAPEAAAPQSDGGDEAGGKVSRKAGKARK
jgi:hypothetical protein